MSDFTDLETALHPAPLFYVEPVPPSPGLDPRLWPELERQKAFIVYMRRVNPHIITCAIPNAGKRGIKAARQTIAEGLVKGAFDTFIAWQFIPDGGPSVTWFEWKGFDARGRAGKLTDSQIEFGNRLHNIGHKCACFYTVGPALDFLRDMGAPLRGRA